MNFNPIQLQIVRQFQVRFFLFRFQYIEATSKLGKHWKGVTAKFSFEWSDSLWRRKNRFWKLQWKFFIEKSLNFAENFYPNFWIKLTSEILFMLHSDLANLINLRVSFLTLLDTTPEVLSRKSPTTNFFFASPEKSICFDGEYPELVKHFNCLTCRKY